MCGILGFATSKPSAENVKYLRKILYLSAIRGTDATGIAYVKDSNIIIEKDNIAADEFIKKFLSKHEDELAKANIALGHTRTPTIGTPKDNNNNHPIESDSWVMIHNGSVHSLKKIDGYKYKGEVDSEILLSYIEKYGLKEGLPYVGRTGTAAVAFINRKELDTIYLWRETNPIRLAYDEASETIFFASQDDFLTKSLTNKLMFFSTFQMRELPENLLIKITINPLTITPIDYVKVVTSAATSAFTISGTKYSNNNYANGNSAFTSSVVRTSLGLQLNNITKRWEKVVETKNKSGKVKEDEPHIYKLLIELGYDELQINRMDNGTMSAIIYASIKANSVIILENGSLQYIVATPIISTVIGQLPNKYHIKDQSKDFKGWFKLTSPNRGYISYDGELIKKWDKEKEQHYIMMLKDAIEEKLIDDSALQNDLDDIFGLAIADFEEHNNVPKELMS